MVTLTSGILEICIDFEFCPEAHIPHLLLSNKAPGCFNAYGFGDWLFALFAHKRSKPHQPCALNVDGSLKDTKDIIFYNDPDDTVPLSAPSSAQPASSTSTTPTGLDAFSVLLQTGRKPVPLTAGSRRSIRTSKPSAHLHDADKACSSTSRKRALSSATEQLVRKKVVLQLSAPLSDNESAGANTDIDTDLGAPGAGQSDEAEDEDAPDEPEDEPEDLLDTTL
ncbi:hypothetical protein F4604DRAFT_1690469 [Suillus subluteus]|nr:hypothetical protein F4604DRAFT_1690469 [Suillus subluteus]